MKKRTKTRRKENMKESKNRRQAKKRKQTISANSISGIVIFS